jgi:hypothetical protein
MNLATFGFDDLFAEESPFSWEKRVIGGNRIGRWRSAGSMTASVLAAAVIVSSNKSSNCANWRRK